MFRRYSFDIKPEMDKLKLKMDKKDRPEMDNSIDAVDNWQNQLDSVEISIAFESPVTYSERKFEEQKNNYYVVPPGNFFIKAQLQHDLGQGPAKGPCSGVYILIYKMDQLSRDSVLGPYGLDLGLNAGPCPWDIKVFAKIFGKTFIDSKWQRQLYVS